MKLLYFVLVLALSTYTVAAQAPTLPIDFESTSTTYAWGDFEGGVATVIANPDASGINTSATVGQMVKFAGQVFGGSTLPLAGPIDWGTNNAVTMKVWANRVGAPVLLKFEGATDATDVQVEMMTTVANQWEELTFDFTGKTNDDLAAMTLIYDLGVVGDGSANFTLYFDDIALATVGGGGGNALDFPITFEQDPSTYPWGDFNGGAVTIIANPDPSGANTSAQVAQMVKSGGEVFGGSTLALGGNIDFDGNNGFTMKTWANRVGAPILFKLEGAVPAEVTMLSTVANEWETLEFSFEGLTGANYNAITIIYDLGTVGDGSADFTLYFDDIELAMLGGGSNALAFPIDFEQDPSVYNWTDFNGGAVSIIANPDASGINTSAQVAQMVKSAGAVFGGSTLALGGAIDFDGNNGFTMKTWANRVGAPVLFKLEGPVTAEVSAMTTVANEWETLEFSFDGLTGGTYTAITIIYDLGTEGDGSADFTLYFDDIELAMVSGGGPDITFPIDFESDMINYNWMDFAGGVASVIDNPDPSGINTSAKVGQMIKFTGEVFGGSTLPFGGSFQFDGETTVTMKTWANRVGAPVLVKFEGAVPVEASATTTVANEWEELSFDFTGMNMGTYTALTIIYDLGTVGDGSADFTLYFDDVQLGEPNQTVDLGSFGVVVAPNPVTRAFQLRSEVAIDAVEIYSMRGQLVQRFVGRLANRDLEVAELPAGNYLIRATTEQGVGSTMLLKQ